jgi:hypothetical protein
MSPQTPLRIHVIAHYAPRPSQGAAVQNALAEIVARGERAHPGLVRAFAHTSKSRVSLVISGSLAEDDLSSTMQDLGPLLEALVELAPMVEIQSYGDLPDDLGAVFRSWGAEVYSEIGRS